MAANYHNLFFTGKDDLRDGCIVIGEDIQPRFFRFDTPQLYSQLGTITTVYRDNDEAVAEFFWSSNMHFGHATVLGRQIHMCDLAVEPIPGAQPSVRRFECDRQLYEWRRRQDDPGSYDLLAVPSLVQQAIFRRIVQDTIIGPSHGFLQYTFVDDDLLLQSLLALVLTRWIDLYGF